MKKTLWLLLALSALPLAGQPLRVAKADAPQSVAFAAPFTAQVLLEHPQGQQVVLEEDSVAPDFTLTAAELTPAGPGSTQAALQILPFTLQQSTFTVSFSLAGQPEVKVPVEIPLTVTPVKLFKDNKLKEIRPPHRPFDWATWLGILLTLIAIVCLVVWWMRKIKQDPARLQAPADNRPAHVIALSQVDALLDSGLWENKQYKLFYITLTDILRTYLHRAFGLDVSADTSAELLRHLKSQAQLSTFIPSLRAFLASGDLVKFAKAVPDEKTRNQDILVLREFIEQTAPKPQPEVPQHVEVKL